MKDITLKDLKEVMTTTIRAEVRNALRQEVPALVRREVRIELDIFREEIDERFNEVLQAIGERFDDHETRIQHLEKIAA